MILYPEDPEAAPCSGAAIDSTGLYRYALWRKWGTPIPLVFVMLNPSTADAMIDDPTIRRCCGFARSIGLGGIVVVNLYAYRSTDPAALGHVDDPVGPENNDALMSALGIACGVGVGAIAAWGKPTGLSRRMRDDVAVRARAVVAAADAIGTQLSALAVTTDGHPRHPLYLPSGLIPAPWSAP